MGGADERAERLEMQPLLAMKNIRKSFSGWPVLNDVSFEVRAGEVHVLAGENGAGKTTLISILGGIHGDFEGSIEIGGRPVRFSSPHGAAMAGVSLIHQEMSLAGALSAIDNIFLGREPTAAGSLGLLIDQPRRRMEAAHLCARLGLEIDLDRPIEEYPVSVQQRIEIAKALASRARILVMDEPTSALSAPEVDALFGVIAELKAAGSGIIYITHRMEEIYRIADRITVLRDGVGIGTARAAELPEPELIRWMIGRELSAQIPAPRGGLGEERLRVVRFSVSDAGFAPGTRLQAEDISFSVHAGEVLGIAGLQGSGIGALVSGLFGISPSRGEVFLDGRRLVRRSPRNSILSGLAYIGNDRKRTGLIWGMDVAQNISLASLHAISRWGFISARRESQTALRGMNSFGIRAASGRQGIETLSGGNQQKVLLARWAATSPKVLLLDEPTRGIDVASKHEVYEFLRQWAVAGLAIIVVTSDMEELLGLSDRILVLHRGRMTGAFSRAGTDRELVLRAAMGMHTPPAGRAAGSPPPADPRSAKP
jgi:ribose transport system ATP-binding protein